MTQLRRTLPFGAEMLPSGGVRFRLWAPDAEMTALAFEGGEEVPMRRDADGWFEAIAAAPAGRRYRYRLADGTRVPDPASRAQDGDVDAPSIVVDPYAYTWHHGGWRGRPWHEAVVYELHTGLFGGFDGVRAQLPALARLGITAIELMPVAQFPGRRNWGYDGVLPFAPAAAYGTPADLKRLVDEAHGLGLMVLLDVVYNHFGPSGNYLPRYASAFFRDDLQTPWGPAIDFRRPQVREFFIENALYWLQEYRLDGLRLDAVHAIAERDWLLELARRVRADTAGRHVHLVLENERNDAALLEAGFTAQWNDDAHHVLHVLLTSERDGYYADYAEDADAKLARWLAQGFVFQGERMDYLQAPRGQPSGHLPPTCFVNCLQNHDQIGNRALGDRLAEHVDPARLRAAAALLLLCPQIPMLFMGEEHASVVPFRYFTDYRGELADAVREGRRAEFARFPAFSDPARRELIPDPNDPRTFEDSAPELPAKRSEHAEWLRKVLAVRREAIVPGLPGATALSAYALGMAAVRARWRLGDGSTLTVLANLGEHDVPLPQDADGAAAAGGQGARLLHETPEGASAALPAGRLPGATVVALLDAAS